MKIRFFLLILCWLPIVRLCAIATTPRVPSTDSGPSGVLDSLLLVGDNPGFLAKWDVDHSAGLSGQYEALADQLRSISGATGEGLEARCYELDSAVSKIDLHYAGGEATVLIRRFQDAARERRWKDALVSYVVAMHFRNRHIRTEKVRLRGNLDAAVEAFRSERFDEVLRAVETFRAEDPMSPAVIVLNDTLAPEYAKLERMSLERLSAIKKESEAQVVGKRLAVSLGGGMSLFGQLERGMTIMRYEEVELFPEPPTADVKPSYSVEVEYAFSPMLSLSLNARGGQVYNEDVFAEPFGTVDPARVHFEEHFSMVSIGPKLFLREKTGLRPFCGLSFGMLMAHRQGATLQSAKWEQWGVFAELGEKSKRYPLVELEIGTEFEPAPQGLFFFGVYLTISDHFGDTELIRHFVGSSELRAGLNVL